MSEKGKTPRKGGDESGYFRCTMPECERVFRNEHDLQTHLNGHTDLKEYVCTLSADCGKAFQTVTDWSHHARRVHGKHETNMGMPFYFGDNKAPYVTQKEIELRNSENRQIANFQKSIAAGTSRRGRLPLFSAVFRYHDSGAESRGHRRKSLILKRKDDGYRSSSPEEPLSEKDRLTGKNSATQDSGNRQNSAKGRSKSHCSRRSNGKVARKHREPSPPRKCSKKSGSDTTLFEATDKRREKEEIEGAARVKESVVGGKTSDTITGGDKGAEERMVGHDSQSTGNEGDDVRSAKQRTEETLAGDGDGEFEYDGDDEQSPKVPPINESGDDDQEMLDYEEDYEHSEKGESADESNAEGDDHGGDELSMNNDHKEGMQLEYVTDESRDDSEKQCGRDYSHSLENDETPGGYIVEMLLDYIQILRDRLAQMKNTSSVPDEFKTAVAPMLNAYELMFCDKYEAAFRAQWKPKDSVEKEREFAENSIKSFISTIEFFETQLDAIEPQFIQRGQQFQEEITNYLSALRSDLTKAKDEANRANLLCVKATNEQSRAEALASKNEAKFEAAKKELVGLRSAGDVAELKQHISKLKTDAHGQQNIITNLKQVVLNKNDEVTTANSEISKKDVLISEKEKLVQQLSDDAEKVRNLNHELTKTLADVRQEKETAEESLQLSEQRLQELDRKKNESEKKQLRDLLQSHKELCDNLTKCNEQLTTARKKINKMEEIINIGKMKIELTKAQAMGLPPPRATSFHFIVRIFGGPWNYGHFSLNDVDELCLSQMLELTGNVIRLILTEMLRQCPIDQPQVGLHAFDWYFYDPDLFRLINRAEFIKNIAAADKRREKGDNISDEQYVSEFIEGEELDDSAEQYVEGAYKPRPLLDAPKPHDLAKDQRWGLGETKNDFLSRKSHCVLKALQYRFDRDSLSGRSNGMFLKKGIFFTAQLTSHWMLLLFVNGSKLSENDRSLLRKLFNRDSAMAIDDDGQGGFMHEDEVKLDGPAFILIDTKLEWCRVGPKLCVIECYRQFLYESHMKLLETGVPDTIREAPCYVADLPQLGDDADSGLYICEIIGRLLRGQPLDFHEGDFDIDDVRLRWLEVFHTKKEEAQKNGHFRLVDEGLPDVNSHVTESERRDSEKHEKWEKKKRSSIQLRNRYVKS